MDEAGLAAFLEGKFFWEPSATSLGADCPYAIEIRRAQEEFSKGAKHYMTARRLTKDTKVNAIKKPTRALRGEEKILEGVITAVSQVYDVSFDDLMGKSTSSYYSAAKNHMYWSFFRYMPFLTAAHVGRLLKKCHTTILHGRKSYESNPNPAKTAEIDKIMGHKECGS